MQLHPSGQLAKAGLSCMAGWPGWGRLSLGGLSPPPLLHSMRILGQSAKRVGPQCVGSHQASLALFANISLAKANHKAKVSMKVKKECTQVWMFGA